MDKHVEVTQVLLEASSGREGAADRLWSLVYDELRRIAHQQLRSERDRRHLSTTALVHEAYLRLVDESRITWKNRSHFFGVATMVMRQVLVDNARKYLARSAVGGSAMRPSTKGRS